MTLGAEEVFVPVATVIITTIMVAAALLIARMDKREANKSIHPGKDFETKTLPKAS